MSDGVSKCRLTAKGFSILEILAALALLAIATMLVLPAVYGIMKTVSRNSAISSILTTLENARTEAIASGRCTYAVFKDRDYPSVDAMLVVSQSEDEKKLDVIGNWIYLPQNIGFYQTSPLRSIFKEQLPNGFNTSFENGLSNQAIGVNAISPQGTIWYPSLHENAVIILQNYFQGGIYKYNTELLTECIRFSKSTGRARKSKLLPGEIY